MSGADSAVPGPTRRLFFALWPDEAQRAALAQAIHKSVRACGGRPVPAHNLHATLAFLGSVPETRIPELDAIARAVARGSRVSSVLQLTFDRLEHWARPQILVALGDGGVAAPPAARADAGALAATLKDATAAAGFSPDLKLFHAHVTVARKVQHPPPPHTTRAVRWEFAAFALIDSRTRPDGPLYSVVASYPLVNVEKARE